MCFADGCSSSRVRRAHATCVKRMALEASSPHASLLLWLGVCNAKEQRQGSCQGASCAGTCAEAERPPDSLANGRVPPSLSHSRHAGSIRHVLSALQPFLAHAWARQRQRPLRGSGGGFRRWLSQRLRSSRFPSSSWQCVSGCSGWETPLRAESPPRRATVACGAEAASGLRRPGDKC